MRESLELSNFSNIQKQGSILTKCPPMQKLSLAHRRRRITLTSIHYRAKYALRVTLLSTCRRAFKWFAASAERKCIFNDEKLMNPAFFHCFSWFSNFSNFSCFWDHLTIEFDFVAWFPARGSFQIAPAWNIKSIQIFVFIWCSCAVLSMNSTASKNGPQTTAPR